MLSEARQELSDLRAASAPPRVDEALQEDFESRVRSVAEDWLADEANEQIQSALESHWAGLGDLFDEFKEEALQDLRQAAASLRAQVTPAVGNVDSDLGRHRDERSRDQPGEDSGASARMSGAARRRSTGHTVWSA